MVLPNYGYKVQNTEDSRTIVLGTIKKILSLPQQKDVFLDLQIRFHHLDTFTTLVDLLLNRKSDYRNVIADMTLVKGPDESEVRKKKHNHTKPRMLQKKNEVAPTPLVPLKAVLRALPSGEYYAVHNWTAPAPRVQLVVEELAIREIGPDRDDETSKDVLSFETGNTRSASETALQQPIRANEEPVVSESQKKGSCDTVEQPKDVHKESPVQSNEKPKEESKELLVENKKDPVQMAEKPKENMKNMPKEVLKESSAVAQQTNKGPKKAAVLTAGWVQTKPGAKRGQTDLHLTVCITKE